MDFWTLGESLLEASPVLQASLEWSLPTSAALLCMEQRWEGECGPGTSGWWRPSGPPVPGWVPPGLLGQSAFSLLPHSSCRRCCQETEITHSCPCGRHACVCAAQCVCVYVYISLHTRSLYPKTCKLGAAKVRSFFFNKSFFFLFPKLNFVFCIGV